MARRIGRKQLRRDEVLGAAIEVEHWVTRNWKTVATGVGALLALGLFGLGWGAWTHRRSEEAARHLGEGLRLLYPLPVSSATAVPPEPKNAEALAPLERAVELGGSSPPGLVATYSRAVALLRTGRADEAARLLESLASSKDLGVLAGPAKALLARAWLASGDASKAESVWRELSQGKTAGYPAEMALLDLARMLRSLGREQEALQALQELLARFPQSPAAQEARGELARGGSPAP